MSNADAEELATLIRERIHRTEMAQQVSSDPDGLCEAAIAADERFLEAVIR